MLTKTILFLLFIFSLFFYTNAHAAYFSADLKDAIKYECKKSVKEKKYPNKSECKKSLSAALELQGVVSVKKVPDTESQLYIETLCVFEIKIGALQYNECIYEEVNNALGIEIIDPPVLVVPDEADDPEVPPKEIPMPLDVRKKVFNKVIPATYFVIAMSEDNTGGSGTAVAIDKDIFVTNCHVIQKKENDNLHDEIFLLHVDKNIKDREAWIKEILILARDSLTDRCIMWKEGLSSPYVKTRDFDDLEMFEEVYAIGNPKGIVGKPTKGEILRLFNSAPPILWEWDVVGENTPDMPYIFTNVAINKGNSGGGLFDRDANLIGVTTLCETAGGAVIKHDIEDPTTWEHLCNINSPETFSIPISEYLKLLR